MENFEFCVGTDILFGRKQLERLPEVMTKLGKKVLLVYGGGSIKRTGLYPFVCSVCIKYSDLAKSKSCR